MPGTSSLRVYYDADADLGRLRGRTVAIIGYGSQGHAHALNLRESGVSVIVGLRPGGGSWARAAAEGLDVRPVADAARAANVVMMLVPDQHGRAVYEQDVAAAIVPGKTLMFAHGFNVHFKQIVPPAGVDVSMVAPKSPGHLVRSEFQAGRGVPALVAVEGDASGHALADALAYAAGIGCTRAGVLPTTFREETESDLFGEQVVLCGGVTALIKAGFETLVAAGYAPELAYFECLHELKLIVDLMYRGGMKFMRYSISDTAAYGDYTRGSTLNTHAVRARMQQILADIQRGPFARGWTGAPVCGPAPGSRGDVAPGVRGAAARGTPGAAARADGRDRGPQRAHRRSYAPDRRRPGRAPGRSARGECPRVRHRAVRSRVSPPGHRARDRPRAGPHAARDGDRMRRFAYVHARRVRGARLRHRDERGRARARD